MTLHANPAARLPRLPSLPLPVIGGDSDCPLWDDLQALAVLWRFPAA